MSAGRPRVGHWFIDDDNSRTWMHRAACRLVAASLFFPERTEDTGPAKAVCAQCPVRDECLAYALEHHEKFGIWGGLSERQRRRLRKQQAAA